MSDNNKFTGFPKETVDFYAQLMENNSRLWFDKNRTVFDDIVIPSARNFVVSMGERLHKISPSLVADPRIDKSIFRIHRDTRFSKNKAPYKTHLGIWFWENALKKSDSFGFYFQLSPPHILLAVGMHYMPSPSLATYRKAVADDKLGPALARAINTVRKNGKLELGGSHYKRVPRGFDPDHKRADLLKHSGVYFYQEMTIPKAVHTSRLIEFCFKRFEQMAPIHKWLKKAMISN